MMTLMVASDTLDYEAEEFHNITVYITTLATTIYTNRVVVVVVVVVVVIVVVNRSFAVLITVNLNCMWTKHLLFAFLILTSLLPTWL